MFCKWYFIILYFSWTPAAETKASIYLYIYSKFIVMKLRILCPMSSGFVIYTVVNIFRQATDRAISLIDQHSNEAVQPPGERAQRGVPTYSKLCLTHTPQFIIVFHTSKDSNFTYIILIHRRLFVCLFVVGFTSNSRILHSYGDATASIFHLYIALMRVL